MSKRAIFRRLVYFIVVIMMIITTNSIPVLAASNLVKFEIYLDYTKTLYTVGDTLDMTADGIAVHEYYNNGSRSISGYRPADFSCTPTKLMTVGNQVITVTHNETGLQTTFTVTVNPIFDGLQSIIVNPTGYFLTEGDSRQLTVTYNPSDTTDKAINWTSDNPNLVTVSNNGLITVKPFPLTTITPYSYNDTHGSGTVYAPIVNIGDTIYGFCNTSAALRQGTEVKIWARSATNSAIYSSCIVMVNSDISRITWTSSNTNVAKVISSNGNNCSIVAQNAGTAVISATYNNNGNIASGSFTVTVSAAHVPVTSITGVPTTATAGTSLALTGTVSPSNATNKAITWSVISSGTTGATISGNMLNATTAGTVTVRATINDGKAIGSNYTQDFSITVSVAHVAVTSITGVPNTATAGTPLTLAGTVNPSNATNKTLTWSIVSAGTTGATINGSTLNTTAAGAVTVRATINDGKAIGSNYTQDFSITVSAAHVSVTSITGVPTTATAGTSLALTGTVNPSNATNKAITWSVVSSGTTGATINGNTLNATAAGTVTIRATITNGKAIGSNYTQDFTITVNAAHVPVTSITGVPTTMTAGTPLALTSTVNPSNATNKTIAWSVVSAGTTGTTINGNTLNATAAGTVTIRATIANGKAVGSNYTQDFNITVNAADVKVTGVYFTNSQGAVWQSVVGPPMKQNETLLLMVAVNPNNATNKNISFTSSNTSIVTVSAIGLVTAKSEGIATITVKTEDGGYTATYKITVEPADVKVTGVSLNTTSLTLKPNEIGLLMEKVLPSNATNKTVSYTSSNTNIATVSSNGIVTAKSEGTTIITVKTADGGYTATCIITVNPLTPTITLSSNKYSCEHGDSVTITAKTDIAVTGVYLISNYSDIQNPFSGNGTNWSIVIPNIQEGTYILKANVIINGNSYISAPIYINVTKPAPVQTLKITSAVPDKPEWHTDEKVNITVKTNIAASNVSIEFNGNSYTYWMTGSGTTWTWLLNMNPGDRIITIKAYDSNNKASEPYVVPVKVNGGQQSSSDLDKKLEDLKKEFPQGWFWCNSSDHLSASKTKHDNHETSSSAITEKNIIAERNKNGYGCNYYDGSTTCVGFARYMGLRIFGTEPVASWKEVTSKSEVDNLTKGDYVVFQETPQYQHAFIYLGREGSNIIALDCNNNQNSAANIEIIRWDSKYDATTVKNNLIKIRKHP